MLFKSVRSGLIAAALVATSIAVPSVSRAQDALKYGDAVTGEITASAKTVEYTFTGAEGDLVIINVGQAKDSDLEMEVQVASAGGDEVANSKEQYTSYSAQAALELPEAGDYTVTVSVSEDAGDSGKTGEFNLNITKAELLEVGGEVSGEVTSETTVYYELPATEATTLTFTKTDGDFNPAVILSTINTESSNLSSIGELNTGDYISAAALTIQPIEGRVIIAVTEATFDFNFETVTAEYTISLK